MPHVVDSLPPVEEFTEPVYNQVHQEQSVAGEMTLNIVENPAVQEQVIVQENSELQVMERIQEHIMDITDLVPGRDLTEFMMRSSPSAGTLFMTTAERKIVCDVKEKLCYLRLITTQRSNRHRERTLATLL